MNALSEEDVRLDLLGTRLSNITLWQRVGELKDRLETARMNLARIAVLVWEFRREDDDDLVDAIRRLVDEHKVLSQGVIAAIESPDTEVRLIDGKRRKTVIVCPKDVYDEMRDKADRYDRLVDKCCDRVRRMIASRRRKEGLRSRKGFVQSFNTSL